MSTFKVSEHPEAMSPVTDRESALMAIITEQSKVLKQALETLQYRGLASWRKRQPTIAAILEILK